jgi:hypothetical protein
MAEPEQTFDIAIATSTTWLANDERSEAAGFELKYIPRNVTIMLTLVIMQFGM